MLGGDREIEPDALLAHIKFLASDDLKGRGNGTEGLERAADYIAEQFKAAGLQPGVAGRWFQPFELDAGLVVGPDNTSRSRPRPDDQSRARHELLPARGPGQQPDAIGEAGRLPLVFAGYGLAVPDLGYDDYASVDVTGKAVLIFTHEPQEHEADSRFNGTRPMPQTSLQGEGAAARSKGARAVLVVSDPSHRNDEGQYSLFASDPDADDQGIPVLRVSRSEMQPLLERGGSTRQRV